VKTLLRVMAVVMVIAGLALASAPALQGATCSGGGNTCTTSAGHCCSADDCSCWTYICPPLI
jgi:hypothetical protein